MKKKKTKPKKNKSKPKASKLSRPTSPLRKFPALKRRRTLFIPIGGNIELVAGMTEEEEEKPVVISWLENPSSGASRSESKSVYKQLSEQIFDPDPERSKVVTLHLYVEYWLDRILEVRSMKTPYLFWEKAKSLNDAGALEKTLYENILTINRLRNIYAHKLELKEAHPQVRELIEKITLDPHFMCTDKDYFRLVCLQTMFLLEATFDNGGHPPVHPFPAEETKERLLRDKRIHWQYCELLKKEQKWANVWHVTLRCPNCNRGVIVREKDDTPGFRESWMTKCEICGLTGDGSDLLLSSIQTK